MSMKKNGWFRLWIVISVLMAIALTLSCARSFPTEGEVRARYIDSLGVKWAIEGERKKLGALPESEVTEEQIQRSQQVVDSVRARVAQLEEEAVLNLPTERAIEVSKFFGIWIAWSVSTFALGWAIGWIYRGFRPKVDSAL